MAWKIKRWDDLYENAQSRKAGRLRWVPIPNKHDGRGYRRIAKHPRAVEIFCAWNLILQVASKMPVRGSLVDADGSELGAEDLADTTGFPAGIFQVAFEVLSSARIGWIYNDSGTTHYQSATSPLLVRSIGAGLNGMEGIEGREGKEIPTESCPQAPQGGVDGPVEVEDKPAADEVKQETDSKPDESPTVLVFPIRRVGKGKFANAKEWRITAAKVEEYRLAFPDIDVLAVLRVARQWCLDNPTKRKTGEGMPSFLTRWLNRKTTESAHRNPSANGTPPSDPWGDDPPWTDEDERIMREESKNWT